MRNRFALKGFSVMVVLALCAVMVLPAAAFVGTFPVTVNGGWAEWTNGKFPAAFTLTDSGTFKYVSNCTLPRGTVTLTVTNFDVPIGSFVVPNCNAGNVQGQVPAGGPDDYYGKPGSVYFSLPLAPGTYSLLVTTPPFNIMVNNGGLTQWVRVDAYGKPLTRPAIILTVNDPPLGAWTSVQWLNLAGTQWTDVEAWLGPLDQSAYGWMPHWIDDKDMGTGPFRWVVYDKDPSQGGKVWGMTQAFYFPKAYEWTWFTVNKGDVMVTTPVVPAQP